VEEGMGNGGAFKHMIILILKKVGKAEVHKGNGKKKTRNKQSRGLQGGRVIFAKGEKEKELNDKKPMVSIQRFPYRKKANFLLSITMLP
jgi:hypothetical protein